MTLTDNDYAYLRSELGPVDRSDMDYRLRRLGSAPAVALEVLRERRAALVADPLTVTVQGVATVSNSENLRALERQIDELGTTAGNPFEVLPIPLGRGQSR